MEEKRKYLNSLIEAYSLAVRSKDADAVCELFAVSINHVVHGQGNDLKNPWNSKKETNKEGIRKIYTDFFSNTNELNIEYVDRIIDSTNNSAAMVVKVVGENVNMENALQIKWNENGKIIYFFNWYGVTP